MSGPCSTHRIWEKCVQSLNQKDLEGLSVEGTTILRDKEMYVQSKVWVASCCFVHFVFTVTIYFPHLTHTNASLFYFYSLLNLNMGTTKKRGCPPLVIVRLWRHILFGSWTTVALMNGMATASFSWQPRCALVTWAGDRTRYSERVNLDLRLKCPLLSSDLNRSWIFSADFSKTLQYKLSRKSIKCEPSCLIRIDRRTLRSK
jgi:hypothetical protein